MRENKIFISHRSTDKEVADLLLNFFAITVLPKDFIFCSSLPGNDVKNKISEEIKQALQDSIVDIVILSKEYYESAYCLNEEGIIWFQGKTVIIIALPEVNDNNMVGFLDHNYKLRRLDCEDDIAAIYDQITNVFSIKQSSVTTLTYQIQKLKKCYCEYLTSRETNIKLLEDDTQKFDVLDNSITDDEKIILYYIYLKKIRKVTNEEIKAWLTEKEIYNINIENGFDILASSGVGILNIEEKKYIFELENSCFRTIIKSSSEVKKNFEEVFLHHRFLSEERFISMWDSRQFNDYDLLFISYIYDKKNFSFGVRWMADLEIESIRTWENDYCLKEILSENYDNCLSKFIENNLVHESSWTSYGNVREYALNKSIKYFLLNKDFPYREALKKIKNKYLLELPF